MGMTGSSSSKPGAPLFPSMRGYVSLIRRPSRWNRTVVATFWTAVTIALVLLTFFSRPSMDRIVISDELSRVIPDSTNASLISHKIWQIGGHRLQGDETRDIQSWLAQNPGYAYTYHRDVTAIAYARASMNDDGAFADALSELRNTGLRSDLMRYMLLWLEGGVYTDVDTKALQPIDNWVPPQYRDKARLVVGLEWDERDDDPKDRYQLFFHELQLCQWTIGAAPRHPVFKTIIDSALANLRAIQRKHGADSFATVPWTNRDVLTSTGPAAWTVVLFEHMRKMDPSITALKDLSGLKEPRLVGDILVMPINAFGMGQPHSGSEWQWLGRWPKNALVRHWFRGSWKEDVGPDDIIGSSDAMRGRGATGDRLAWGCVVGALVVVVAGVLGL